MPRHVARPGPSDPSDPGSCTKFACATIDALRLLREASHLRLIAILRCRGWVGQAPPVPTAWQLLAAEFPGVELTLGIPMPPLPTFYVWAAEWSAPRFNFAAHDRRLDRDVDNGGPLALAMIGDPATLPRAARQVLTRGQRCFDRRNHASRARVFDRVLAAHRAAHDLARPAVRAHYDHALDSWQWLLRLAPAADLALQLAALLHDVQSLEPEADARRGLHDAAESRGLQEEHAARSAEIAAALLARAGVDEALTERAARLIAARERPPLPDAPDADALAHLRDADALSFFSLLSPAYLADHGADATRRRVAHVLRRLRPASHRHLLGLRLPHEVAAAVKADSLPSSAPRRSSESLDVPSRHRELPDSPLRSGERPAGDADAPLPDIAATLA